MTLLLATVFLIVPVLVWRYFRARRLAYVVITLWLGPVLFLFGFDIAMSGCANLPYTAIDGYLDCPSAAHDRAYAIFGPLASLLVVAVYSQGLASFAWYLLPLGAGILLEVFLRRSGP